MSTGAIDHPSYTTRQTFIITNLSTAGASAVQGATSGITFPFDVRLRNAVAIVQTAGTSSGTGAACILYTTGTSVAFPNQTLVYGTLTVSGTVTTTTTNTASTNVGVIALGSAVAGSYAVSGDMNIRIPAGQTLLVKNGTDATSRYSLCVEYHLDPVTSTWTSGD